MTSLSVSEARESFAEALGQVSQGPVNITRHGETIAVMIDPVVYQKLTEAAEEIDDARAFDEALEEGSDLIPWDDVKRDLGYE
jgi:prevent-host-death family protein